MKNKENNIFMPSVSALMSQTFQDLYFMARFYVFCNWAQLQQAQKTLDAMRALNTLHGLVKQHDKFFDALEYAKQRKDEADFANKNTPDIYKEESYYVLATPGYLFTNSVATAFNDKLYSMCFDFCESVYRFKNSSESQQRWNFSDIQEKSRVIHNRANLVNKLKFIRPKTQRRLALASRGTK